MALRDKAVVLHDLGDLTAATAASRQAADESEQVAPRHPHWSAALAVERSNLAGFLLEASEFDTAVANMRCALGAFRALIAAEPPHYCAAEMATALRD